MENWDEAASQLEVWEVFCDMFLGAADTHAATAKMMALVKETPCIHARL